MAHYESMYIVHPALETGRLKDLILSVESTLKELGGTTLTIEAWGKKKLAYPINKEKYGMYVLFQFEADGSKNKEFNTTLDHNTNILAYLTTKIEKHQLLTDVKSLDSQLGLDKVEATKEETSSEETTKEETSSEETTKEETSSEETTKEETSSEETTKEETSKQDSNDVEDSNSDESSKIDDTKEEN
jgi:ribosomal protein S6